MGEVLIDTNIFVYAYDAFDSIKQARAVETTDTLIRSGRGRISTQVLGEFVSASTRSRRQILTLQRALAEVTIMASAFHVFDVTPLIVFEAIRGVREHQLSFFDAQLWATARLNQVETIFSEDFQHGRRIEGVRFLSPLLPEFDLAAWE